MKQAVFISAGIGNALLLVPLIKELQKNGEVTLMDTTPYFKASELFGNTSPQLMDRTLSIKSLRSLFQIIPHLFKRFDATYLDFFSSTRKNLILSWFISNEIVTNKIPEKTPGFIKRKIRFVAPITKTHEGLQYLRFANEKPATLSENSFQIHWKAEHSLNFEHYITIQPFTGNGKAPWKDWPVNNWLELILKINAKFPGIKIVLLGDQNEVVQNSSLSNVSSIISMVGKTTIPELISIISKAHLHLGGDSGLMHIAGCSQIPTVIIRGGSDTNIYGWEVLNPKRHQVIKHDLACHPCSRWILPNLTRVKSPVECPDFKCIRLISVNEVWTIVEEKLSNAF